VSGEERAEEILAGLYRDNHFVTLRRTQPQPVYQYHPMFREFLLARVRETLHEDRRRAALRTAAAAMEATGQGEEAVALYRESRDWDEMARLIGAHAEAMLGQGRGETLAHWVEDLPPEARERHPWVEFWAAASRAQIAPREARVRYEKAFERFRALPSPDRTGMALAASGAMDAILYELDDFSLLDRWIAILDEAESRGVSYPSAAVEARVACGMVFSLTLRQPQRRDIERWIARALDRAREVPDPNLKMFVGLLCALTLMWTGVHARALELIEAMRGIAGSPGVSPFSRITLKNVEAMYYMLTADGKRCMEAAREGLELARTAGVTTWTFQLLVHAYGGALGVQDLATAAEFAAQLDAQSARAGRLDQCLYHHFRAWEAMLRKDLMRALHCERTALRMAIEAGCPYFEVLCRLALAEALAECNDERRCIAHLQQLRPVVEGIGNHHLEFTCLTTAGRIAIEHGREHPGRTALRRGLALAREYGYAHFLWWRPEAMARACAHALDAGIEVETVRHLIVRRGLVPARPPLLVEAWPWMFRVRCLGSFELLRHDAPLAAEGKAQRRPLEMLKLLIAQGWQPRPRGGRDRCAVATRGRRLGTPLVHEHAAPAAQAPRRRSGRRVARGQGDAGAPLLLGGCLGVRRSLRTDRDGVSRIAGGTRREPHRDAGRAAARALPRAVHGRGTGRGRVRPAARPHPRPLRPRDRRDRPSLGTIGAVGAGSRLLRELPGSRSGGGGLLPQSHGLLPAHGPARRGDRDLRPAAQGACRARRETFVRNARPAREAGVAGTQ